MSDNISEWAPVEKYQARKESTVRAERIEELHRTGGGEMNTGTLFVIACPKCDANGKNVAWHGQNSHYRCPSCEQVVRVSG